MNPGNYCTWKQGTAFEELGYTVKTDCVWVKLRAIGDIKGMNSRWIRQPVPREFKDNYASLLNKVIVEYVPAAMASEIHLRADRFIVVHGYIYKRIKHKRNKNFGNVTDVQARANAWIWQEETRGENSQ